MLNFLVLLSSSLIGLMLYLRLAPAMKLIDAPTARGLHETPTIVGGGIVPIAIMAASLALSGALPFATIIAAMMAGLAVVGLLDDRWSIPTFIRLVCYLGAGLALPTMVVPPETVPLAVLLVAGVGVAWCINLVNFMDGADGLVVLQTLSVAVGLGLIATFAPEMGGSSGVLSPRLLSGLCAALFACFAPLLFFNWPPARLFMGDAGAVPLGFYLALLGLVALCIDHSLGWVWLVLMMPFLIDSGCTLCIRLLKGHAPHIGHRDHAYQRLTLRAGSPLPIILGLLAMQVVWQFPLAVTIVTAQVFPPLLVLLSAIPALIAVVYARLRA